MSARLRGLGGDLLLAALVALAFWLNGQLWRLPAAGESTPPVYTAPGAVSNLRLGEVLRPARLVLRAPAGGAWLRLPDPQSQAAAALERAALQLAASVEAGRLERAPAVRPADLLGRLEGPAAEILLPAPLPWASWLAVWRSEEAGGAPLASLPSGGPSVDRLLIFAAPAAEGQAAPQLELAAGDASSWHRLPLPQGEAAVAWLAALKAAQGEAVAPEAAALPAGLGAEADFAGATPPAEGLAAPRLAEIRPDPEGLGHAVFGDMALVRRVELVGGQVLFTDGRTLLRFPPRGGYVLERQEAAGGPDRGLGRALLEAVQEVDRLGGWPAGSRLLAARRLPGEAGWQLAFAAGDRGLPLLAAAEQAPAAPAEFQTVPPAGAIDVQVSPAGVVERIAWHVEQVEGRGGLLRPPSLQAALAAASAAGSLPAGATLADAGLAWEPAGVDGAAARPLWLLTLADGRLVRLPTGAEGG
ncbi:MAG: hypothetical protein K6U79_04195 [Firmicutes bacterium]|nr:hypothetical protein [Bacillota bacterium]